MLAILLGAGSGLFWGTADFTGGLQSRRLSAVSVALYSQLAGGIALLAVTLVSGRSPRLDGMLWGAAAGAFGGAGVAVFYRGLAVGAMSIVAPVSACGAVVPVLAGLVLGEIPGVLTGAGMAVVLGGVVLVSRPSATALHPSASHREAVGLGLVAALSFGFFFLLLDRGAATGTDALWVVVGGRTGSLVALLVMALAIRGGARWPGRRAWIVALVGLSDTTANILFTVATTRGALGVVSVLGSLYPVATVLLARTLLAERLSRSQSAGVVLALAGVAMLSAG